MNKEKFNLFLDKLLEKTEQEQIDWEKTAYRDTFLTVIKDSAISICRLSDNSSNVIRFDFRNDVGDIVDVVHVWDDAGENETFKKAEKIYYLAQKKPERIDQTLDELIEQLAA